MAQHNVFVIFEFLPQNRFFGFLENIKLPSLPFKHLLIGQFNLNEQIHELIEYEKNQALAGKKAKIILK